MQLKIRGDHLRCKVSNKCLNVCEWVVVGKKNDGLLISPAVLSLKENPDRKKEEKTGVSLVN